VTAAVLAGRPFRGAVLFLATLRFVTVSSFTQEFEFPSPADVLWWLVWAACSRTPSLCLLVLSPRASRFTGERLWAMTALIPLRHPITLLLTSWGDDGKDSWLKHREGQGHPRVSIFPDQHKVIIQASLMTSFAIVF